MGADWRRTTVGALARQRTEKVLPTRADTGPYVALENISSGTGQLQRVGASGTALSHKTRFAAGDTLFGKLRPNLRKVARANFDGVCSTDIIAVGARAGADTRYLHHLLSSERVYHHVMGDITGTKMPRTSWQRLSSFSFLCPPLTEQRAIAAVLDAIDDTIAHAETAIVRTEALRLSLLHEVLKHGIPREHDGGRTVPGLGVIPASWNVAALGSVLRSVVYGTNVTLSEGGAGIPVVRMGDLVDGRVNQVDLKTASAPIDPSLFLMDGDILLNRTNSLALVGKVGYVVNLRRPSSFASYLLRLRVEPTATDSRWLFEVLHAPWTQERLGRMATPGASQANINPTSLKSLVIAVPPLAEQRRIARLIETVRDYGGAESSRVDHLRWLKHSLADALLSGRVQTIAAQPARETVTP